MEVRRCTLYEGLEPPLNKSGGKHKESQRVTSIHLFRFPDYRRNMTVCITLLLHTFLPSQASQTTSFLKWFVGKYFVTAWRKVTHSIYILKYSANKNKSHVYRNQNVKTVLKQEWGVGEYKYRYQCKEIWWGKRKNIEPNLRKKIRMHYSRVCAITRQKRKSLKLQISDGEMSQVIATDNISCRWWNLTVDVRWDLPAHAWLHKIIYLNWKMGKSNKFQETEENGD